MADSSSFWSDWVNNVTTVSKSQPAGTFTDRFGGTVVPAPQSFAGAWAPVEQQWSPAAINNEPEIDVSNYGGDINAAYKAIQSRIGNPGESSLNPPPAAYQGYAMAQNARGSQQPTIPIQTPQGAPQSPTQMLGGAPNSGMIGATPYSNQALTGGSGMPIGGLPTQSPMQDYNSPQQVNPQQMQMPPVSGPANPQFRMQQHQQNLQNFARLLASMHGYNFLGQS